MNKTLEILQTVGKGISPLVSAGVGIGSILSNAANTTAANEANIELAKQQNAYNVEQWKRENAYNTPYAQIQRLKAAGLNPNLVFAGGSLENLAASSPNMVSGVGSQVPYQVDPLTAAQIANLNAQTRKTDAETKTVDSTRQPIIDNLRSVTQLNHQQVVESVQRVDNLAKEGKLTDAQVSQIKQSMQVELENLGISKEHLKIDNQLMQSTLKLNEAQIGALQADIRLKTAQANVSEREFYEMLQTFSLRVLGLEKQNALTDAQIKSAYATANKLGIESGILMPEYYHSKDQSRRHQTFGNTTKDSGYVFGDFIQFVIESVLMSAGRIF